jgi:hypothetical protein
MKQTLALIGGVFVFGYLIAQALIALLQPLFNALSGKLY